MRSSTSKRLAAIYARISVEDDNVPKVDQQIAACEALALSEGYTVVARFRDDGIPATGRSIREGTRAKRAQFDALIKATEQGQFDVIVTVAGDRLARNYPDGLDVVDACAAGDAVLLTDDDGLLDPRTPAGEERAMALFTGGRREIRARSAKQRRRYDAEINQGKPLWGRRPFGFAGVIEKNSKGKDTIRWTKHEPAEADALKWAVLHLITPTEANPMGGSIWGIIREFEDRGLKTSAAGYVAKDGRVFDGAWTYASVRSLLRSPRIAGLVARGGVVQEVKAAWDPIVSRADWQAVQDKLNDPGRRTNPGRKPSSLGSGLVLCSCGLPMRATSIASRDDKVPGLRCDSSRAVGRSHGEVHCTVRSDVLDPVLIRGVVDAFTFGPSDLLPGAPDADLRPIEAELSKIRKARADLLGLVGEGVADMADVSGKLRTIKLREGDLEAQRQELVSKNAQAAMLVDLRADLWAPNTPMEQVVTGPRGDAWRASRMGTTVDPADVVAVKAKLRERFLSLPLSQQRELVRTLLDVEIIPGKGVKVHPERRVMVTHKVVTTLNGGDSETALRDAHPSA